MRKIVFLIIMQLITGFIFAQHPKVMMGEIDKEESGGNFTKAKYLIDLYIAQNNLTESEIYELDFRKDVMNRIRIDFNRDKSYIEDYIRKYYPDVNDKMLAAWEADKSLEAKIIDGQKFYFSRSAPNLFRINKEARACKLEKDGGPEKDNVEEILKTHLPAVVGELKKNHKTQAEPLKMKVRYSVRLKPDAVPDGEMVKCWLPYPRQDNRQQTNLELLSVSESDYVIAPNDYAHRTIYMQKKASKGQPLEFRIEFSYSSAAEWFDLNAEKVKPYDTGSNLYKTYTSERDPHVIFTDKIKSLSGQIVGDEVNPYMKVLKIFNWINDHYPWAGAREYSTLKNIPEYVIDNNHGDCGQVSLLFITLARYNGIPAKWQSGFMMHPNGLNLHDWAEVYFEGQGWVPVDQSFGRKDFSNDSAVQNFFSNGIDAYRWIVNDDYSQSLFPAKTYPRSETVDFQRGELEWRGGNIYFDKWNWNIDVEYLK